MKFLKSVTLIFIGLFILISCNSDNPETESAVVSHDVILAQIPSLRAESPQQAPGTFVGEVAGSDLLIGLVIQDGQAVAYLCNGDDIGDWLKGSVSEGQVALSSPNSTNLSAEVDDSLVRGTITLPDGQSLTFEAAPAKANSGLFRLVETVGDSPVVTGWILSEAGLKGTTNSGGLPVSSISLTPSGGIKGNLPGSSNQSTSGSNCVDQFTGGCSMPCDGLEQFFNDVISAQSALESELSASGVTNVGDDPVFSMLGSLGVKIFIQLEENGCNGGA